MGRQMDQAGRLKKPEPEKAKLKRVVSQLIFEKLVLKDSAWGEFRAMQSRMRGR